MSEHEVENLVAAGDPARDLLTHRAELSQAEVELRKAIVSSRDLRPIRPIRQPALPTAVTFGGRIRSKRWLGVAAVAAGAAIVVSTVAAISFQDSSDRAVSAAAIEVAYNAPRYLLLADGWSVVRVGEFSPDHGEIGFGRDAVPEVTLYWQPGNEFDDLRVDRVQSSQGSFVEQVGTREVTVADYGFDANRTEYRALWLEGDDAIEVVALADNEALLLELLGSLRLVSVDDWLDAMPPEIVQPGASASEFADILTGVPLPPGTSIDQLVAQQTVGNRNQLAAEALKVVVCGWTDEWFASGSADAQAALGDIRDWPIVKELSANSGWRLIAEMTAIADAIAHGQPVIYGGGPGPLTAEYADGAIDCASI